MRTPACLLSLLLILALPVAAQIPGGDVTDTPGWPDTRAGELGRELFELINSGTLEQTAAFIREHYDAEKWKGFPPDENAAWVVGLREYSGPLEFAATRSYAEGFDDNTVVIIARAAATEQWRGISLTLSPEPPHKVVGMTVMPARAPKIDGVAARPTTVEAFAAELDNYLKRMEAEDRFSGAVLVTRGGKKVFEKAYGLENRRYGVPNQPDTRFNLGSMNKMITAVAVLQLQQQGKLALDDTVDRHLPAGWLAPETASKITVRQLLSHTSGLGDYLGDDRLWNGSRLNFRELEDYRPLFDSVKPEFPPGTDWAYSNTGFLLLGLVVEKASGQSYEDYVRSRVYEPAGMIDTAFYEIDLPVEKLAMGYYRDPEDPRARWRENSLLHVVKGTPAGGGYSTVRDLARFAEALRSDLLLGEAARAQLWRAGELSLQHMPYGLGFVVGGLEGDRRVGHGGGFPGISANLDIHLDSGWTVAVLCNTSGAVGGGTLNTKIADWLDALP